jgi:carbon-monoxide dehydrogenase iron sulfur subunit
MTKMMKVNDEKCTGCRLCELACSVTKTDEFNPALARIRVDWGEEGACVPVVCTQCAEAWCVQACPSEAISRNQETAVVIIDPEQCIECGECVSACPTGAIGWRSSSGAPFKCDLCSGQPACVAMCPAEALVLA